MKLQNNDTHVYNIQDNVHLDSSEYIYDMNLSGSTK